MLGRVWRKTNPATLLVEMSIGEATMGNSMKVSQKTKNRVTTWFSNPTPGHIYPEKTPIWKDACTPPPMFIGALFIITKIWKQPKCPCVGNA